MADDRHRRLGEILHAALGLPPGEREELIERACAGDEALRAEVRSMVQAAGDAGSFLDRPIVEESGSAPLAWLGADEDGRSGPGRLAPGDQFGSFRIIEALGRGGMGDVYLAEQDPPRRHVALKIIRPGMDSVAVVRRFRHEQQALAAMEHPNVARVYEVGVTPVAMGSRPFFTMEYVPGEPITQYCDRKALTIRKRLELFIAVCEAVQHAHHKGIIHRDLKPSNVLVTEAEGRASVKVIDFGIAKAISHAGLGETAFSIEGQLMGTPEYMSPEQAGGRPDVNTRSDVYSMGVLLYELLVGCPPFEWTGRGMSGLEEMRRIIREHEPPRPSTRLMALGAAAEQVAQRRRKNRAALRRELRHELDWVPLKAMRKDRDRRYASPEALADDIRRYLSGRPLRAAPESRIYLFRKFVSRNSGSLAATLAVVASLAFAAWTVGRFSAERNNARFTQYVSAVSMAQDALEANEVAAARGYLDGAPAELKGWEWRYLYAACDESVGSLNVGAPIYTFAISPDGARAAIGLNDGTVMLWDWKERGEPRRLAGHVDEVVSIAFSADGRLLLSASTDATARLWDTATGREACLAMRLKASPRRVAFDADEDRIVVVCDDGSCQVFDQRSGLSVTRFPARAGRAVAGELSGDCSRWVTAGNDGTVEVRRTSDDASLFAWRGSGVSQPRGAAAFSPSGDHIAWTWGKHLCVCEVSVGAVPAEMSDADSEITGVTFSPDGSLVVTTSMEGAVVVWSIQERRPLRVLRGHGATARCPEFSARGDFVTASNDKTVKLWNPNSEQPLACLRGHAARLVQLVLSPDGAWVATRDLDNVVKIWDVGHARGVAAMSMRARSATAANFDRDGSRIAMPSATTDSGTVAVWSGDGVRRLSEAYEHKKQVWSAKFSRDGSRLVTACEDGAARIWDAGLKGEPVVLRHDGGWMNWAEFSPDGNWVVTAAEHHARVWDTRTGSFRELWHPRPVRSAAYSPDGLWIVTACDDGRVRIWNAKTLELVRTLQGHTNQVICVRYSEDGRWIASSSQDRTARIWNAKTGAMELTLVGHKDKVMSVAFSPDGSRIVTASLDQSVRVWERKSGRQLVEFRETQQDFAWAVFSPDGTKLLLTCIDGAVRLLDSVPRARRFEGLEK